MTKVAMGKVLLVSCYFPPEAGGAPVVYENLLRYFDQDGVFVVAAQPRFRTSGSKLTCRVYRCLPLFLTRTRIAKLLQLLWIPVIVLVGSVVCKIHKIDRILGTYPDTTFLISSYLIHKLTGIPFYVYLHDTFVETQRETTLVYLAKFFQNRIFYSARKIFVISEGMSEYYKERYNLHTIIIHHCLYKDYEFMLRDYMYSKNWEANRIVFTGGIYDMNIDAIKVMVETVNSIDNTKLCISTRWGAEAMKKLGNGSNNVEALFLPDTNSVIEFQRRADILYLPLAFEPPWPDEIISVFPTKTVEYLVSGVPILVHAPPSYFLTRFARREGFAFIVDQNDPLALRKGIESLLKDESLRHELVRKAFITAQMFDGRKIAEYTKKHLFED